MTDSRLQELKRAWEASQSVEDEAAYLRERVRVGDLTQERLQLAAYCGHEGACAVAGAEASAEQAIAAHGLIPTLAVLVKFLRSALSKWTKCYADDSRPAEALALAETWLSGAESNEEYEEASRACTLAARSSRKARRASIQRSPGKDWEDAATVAEACATVAEVISLLEDPDFPYADLPSLSVNGQASKALALAGNLRLPPTKRISVAFLSLSLS